MKTRQMQHSLSLMLAVLIFPLYALINKKDKLEIL